MDVKTVDQLAAFLKENVANMTGVVLNGEFSHFCTLLAEHYKGVLIDLPWVPTYAEVAEQIEKQGEQLMPNGEYRRIFARQVAVLKQVQGRLHD